MIDESLDSTTTIEDLPSYVYCDLDGCQERHYLSLNRDVSGNWSAGYIEFDSNTACLFINNAVTLNEAATRMKFSLERHNYSESSRNP